MYMHTQRHSFTVICSLLCRGIQNVIWCAITCEMLRNTAHVMTLSVSLKKHDVVTLVADFVDCTRLMYECNLAWRV